MKHLFSNQCYDEAEVWCGVAYLHEPNWVSPAHAPEEADCRRCLELLEEWGDRATGQLTKLSLAEGKFFFVGVLC